MGKATYEFDEILNKEHQKSVNPNSEALKDENFRKLLRAGSRRELFGYRNSIIDELKRRDEIGVDSSSERLDFAISKSFTIGLIFANVILIMFLLKRITELYHQGNYGLEMALSCIIVIIITLFTISHTSLVFSLHKNGKNLDQTSQPTITNSSIRQIRRDHTDVLKAKKSILDDELGL